MSYQMVYLFQPDEKLMLVASVVVIAFFVFMAAYLAIKKILSTIKRWHVKWM